MKMFNWPCPRYSEDMAGCKAQFYPDGDKRCNPQEKERRYQDTRDTTCHLALVAEDAWVGKVLLTPTNHFEACVVLVDGGRSLHYGGGEGGRSFPTAQAVLEGSFRSFVWYYTASQNNVKQCIAAELVATYRSP